MKRSKNKKKKQTIEFILIYYFFVLLNAKYLMLEVEAIQHHKHNKINLYFNYKYILNPYLTRVITMRYKIMFTLTSTHTANRIQSIINLQHN